MHLNDARDELTTFLAVCMSHMDEVTKQLRIDKCDERDRRRAINSAISILIDEFVDNGLLYKSFAGLDPEKAEAELDFVVAHLIAGRAVLAVIDTIKNDMRSEIRSSLAAPQES